MDFTIRQIVEAAGGQLYYAGLEAERAAFLDMQVDSVVLDSRQVTEGGVFLATAGERVDGHSFVQAAYQKGAVLAIVQRTPQDGEDWGSYLLVGDTLLALKKIAESYREGLQIPVIGVTGSVGKTSTKEFIAGLLSEKYAVLKTQGNYNNEIGVPLTLLQIRRSHKVAVVEMGISDFGEMHRLSQMVKPDIAVITNIGQCHLENLKDRDGVLRAKTEILDFMPENGKLCLNGDDDKLRTVVPQKGRELRFFGLNGETAGEVYATDRKSHGLLGSEAVLHTAAGEAFLAKVPLPGVHMVLNAAAAVCVAELLGLTTDEMQEGLSKVAAVGGRNHLISTANYTLLDDCYNANPVSMKAGLDLLCMADTVTVAILGDMFELGENSDAMHAEVGAYAVKKGVDYILCVGENSRHMYEAAVQKETKSRAFYFATRKELLLALQEEEDRPFPTGSTILIKASHGMQFSKVVELLKEK